MDRPRSGTAPRGGDADSGRVVTNNAASTQPLRELVDLFRNLAPEYENVHRGQSAASQLTTARFEGAYDTIAQFINAPSRANIVVTRNTTEAHNIVMYSLLRRAGCHCATLAHRYLGLNPPASCRLSFYSYNTLDEVDRATDAVADVVKISRGA